MKKGGYLLLAFTLLLIWGTLFSLQLRLDMSKGDTYTGEEFLRLPRAEYLRKAALGFDNLLADMLWLKAVQHIGERKISSEGYDWIYKALDIVSTLDPKYVEPYEVGGLILTIDGNKVDLSNKILEKGVANITDVWQLPYYLGFNYFFYLKDYQKAAEYMSRAASTPGSPPYMPLLASRLYVESKDPAYALEFLGRMYENTKDEGLRERLMQRMLALKSAIGPDGKLENGKVKENLGIYKRGG